MSRATRTERASALLLFPAGVVVIMILSAVAVDLAAVYTAQRSLQREVDAAADDAAAMLDIQRFVLSGDAVIDLCSARRSVVRDLARADLLGDGAPRSTVTPGPRPNTIEVRAWVTVPRIFAGVVPGGDDHSVVRASVIAELIDGG